MRYLLFAVLTLVALAGCNLGSSSTPEATIHSGSEGLVLELQNLPAKVFTEERFSLVGKIENKGAAHVDDGVLSFELERNFVTTDEPLVSQIRLAGKTAALPVGETQSVRLDMTARQLPPATETRTTNIFITLCYPYTTTASATICIDPDLENKVTGKPCTAKTISLSSQGAPVAVEKVEPRYSAHQQQRRIIPQFTVTLSNIGKGSVFMAPRVLDVCTGQNPGETDKVRLRAFLVDRELDCGKDYVTFKRNTGTVTCTLEDGIDSSLGTYSTLLRIELEYGYSAIETRHVEIVRRT